MKPPLIYVLDDDDSVRIALDSYIRCLGFNVETFSSGRQLLASAHLVEVSCVISDVQMPAMNGFDVLAALQQMQPPVPVILLTAFFEDCLKRKALALGATAFLSKPFSSAEMLKALEAVL
ncbi:response regulator [Rheinheimera aquimaris]|uniref:Response regulator n=1 Tax=Rheinheimera aquimaris TaxID=412437 RepID=A0ABP3NN91_9GAMM|nr:response regulator [Rheinheimera aquimaris]MCB5213069.1 response regulator [Rheinheimera aquimaris]